MPLTFAEVDAFKDYLVDKTGATPDALRTAMQQDALVWIKMQEFSQQWADRHRPLVERYLNHLAAPNPRNTAPWQALGERASVVWQALQLAKGEPRIELLPEVKERRQEGMAMGTRLVGAEVYLWLAAMEQTACAAPLPPHIISRDILPFPLMFWSREVAYNGEMSDGRGGEINWFLVYDTWDGIAVTFDFYDEATGQLRWVTEQLDYGARWPDDFPPEQRASVAPLLQMLSLLNSPCIRAEGVRSVPRALRRELGRKGVPEEDPDSLVRVVTLRRPSRPAEEAPDGEGRTTHHRWWVSAHHRAQWYPSLQAHRVIWIQAHVKGDPSLPWIEHVYRVAR